jgi:hypothetical protein
MINPVWPISKWPPLALKFALLGQERKLAKSGQPGSILKLMMDQDITIPKTLFRSFQKYMKLSLVAFQTNSKEDDINS